MKKTEIKKQKVFSIWQGENDVGFIVKHRQNGKVSYEIFINKKKINTVDSFIEITKILKDYEIIPKCCNNNRA